MRAEPARNLEAVDRVMVDGIPLLQASHVSIAVCAHGTTQVNLHDTNGRVFANVSLPPKDAAIFLLRGTEQLEACVASLEQIVRPT